MWTRVTQKEYDQAKALAVPLRQRMLDSEMSNLKSPGPSRAFKKDDPSYKLCNRYTGIPTRLFYQVFPYPWGDPAKVKQGQYNFQMIDRIEYSSTLNLSRKCYLVRCNMHHSGRLR